MKRLLTIACVLFALAGAGRHPIYKTLPGDSTLVRIKPKTDTIPIIYLYSDTARVYSVWSSAGISDGKLIMSSDTSYSPPNPYAYWDFGYEVRERKSWIGAPGTYCANCPPYTMEHTGYLDRHKQPIRKSIVIWQVKPNPNNP